MSEEVKFEIVSADVFNAYIDDIKARLKKEAPEWEVLNQSDGGRVQRLYYHLARTDFSKGKDMTWPVTLNRWIFAYEKITRKNEPTAYYLLNRAPIEELSE